MQDKIKLLCLNKIKEAINQIGLLEIQENCFVLTY